MGKTSSPLVHPSIESISRPLVSTRSQNFLIISSPQLSKDLKGSHLQGEKREQRGLQALEVMRGWLTCCQCVHSPSTNAQ